MASSNKMCKVKNCGNPSRCLNYCNRHYLQIRRLGKIVSIVSLQPYRIIKSCKVKNCGEYSKGLGYCNKHYLQIKRFGKIRYETTRSPNIIVINTNNAEIILKNIYLREVARAIIDLEDVDLIKQYKWTLSSQGYCICVKHKCNLQSIILGYRKNKVIDHQDRDKLNCRKTNLRFVSINLNNSNTHISKNNTSGTVGVHWYKTKNKWQAYIWNNYKCIHLGYFKKLDDAIQSRKIAEQKYFGEVILR